MFVLDASVTMRWYFEAGSHPRADAILDRLASFADTAVVPTIWRYEVSAVLARAQSKDGASAEDASEFLDDLGYLPIQIDSDALIFEHVHGIATKFRLTTYDAAYLELARRKQLPLASLDTKLVAACRLAGVPLL
ncbi:VapC toxin family PIN domain ribonuclease [Beijerinckiaceae bacterium RH AL1]|nr:type II toxin-antitoxin system VapC family toxin [Beijerinckiaceae bacterium]VVB47074.1 VapC toxin family PIN domain ribonuclease [Beijerinckiaceae bacterium RH CH11]VVB47157.1 VapC toxin family PIN domain ribonuclease [Beijerinckiaceae bacterium RH AL8]VVC55703.1 VapC toxin family PIN domain ribonuclease [Beijerinckiaceae bacterium RH AL1]